MATRWTVRTEVVTVCTVASEGDVTAGDLVQLLTDYGDSDLVTFDYVGGNHGGRLQVTVTDADESPRSIVTGEDR